MTSAASPALLDFLARVDVTVSGVDDPDLRLWLLHAENGQIHGSTRDELSSDAHHALIRSVAVEEHLRREGVGRQLARCALGRASDEGARHGWLFGRRSGPFWQQLGFIPADRDELADAEQAPWLLLPFVAGCFAARSPSRAAVLGWAATMAATVTAFMDIEARVFIAGMVSGPVFGWLGYRWRRRGGLVGVVAVVAALCGEPLARSLSGPAIRSPAVAVSEVTTGVVVLVLLLVRRPPRPSSPPVL